MTKQFRRKYKVLLEQTKDLQDTIAANVDEHSFEHVCPAEED